MREKTDGDEGVEGDGRGRWMFWGMEDDGIRTEIVGLRCVYYLVARSTSGLDVLMVCCVVGCGGVGEWREKSQLAVLA